MKTSEKLTNKIVELHKNKLTPQQIAKELGVHHGTIRKVLTKESYILLKPFDFYRTVKTNPFADLNNTNTQYWLGYLAADGCIGSNGNEIIINTNKDPHHLQTYIHFLNYPLKVAKCLNKRYNVYEYAVKFSNPEVKQYLINLGITPRKSLTLNLNINLTWDFVRGYFDGNGYVRYTTDKNVNISIITGSQQFSKQLSEFFTEYSIKHYVKKTKPDSEAINVDVYNFIDITKIYNYFYLSSDTYLIRKKDKFGSNMEKSMLINSANSRNLDVLPATSI